MPTREQRWNDPAYFQMTEVQAREEGVLVTFANSDRVDAKGVDLLPDYWPYYDWRQTALRGMFALEVPLQKTHSDVRLKLPAVADIPPTAIREATDPVFRAYMAWSINYSGSRIGRWLRVLRLQSGMSLRQMADLIGIQAKNLSQIELGWDALTIPGDFSEDDDDDNPATLRATPRAVAEEPVEYQV